MISFGLVTEGITDQEVISNILFGYFKEKNIPVNPLQPIRDETDKSRQGNFGGWFKVIEYCKSEYFSQAFQSCDYIIIQLDTDVCEEYGICKMESGVPLPPDGLVQNVIDHIISEIGTSLYDKIKNRLLFAISVHMIECWLLPLYYSDNKREKTTGCINTLNRELNKIHNFYIDPSNKIFKIYQEISQPLKKNKTLKKVSNHNPSFRIFINHLDNMNIQLGN